MRNASIPIVGLTAAAILGLVGCDVKKTQEGNVTLPKYDVTAPSVEVTKKEAEVTVPKLTTEKETITVPEISVKTAKEKEAEKKAQK